MLSPYWAKRLNLLPGIAIAVGALDAHMGAVVGNHPGTLVKIMGTSTCDILVCSPTLLGERPMEGICGQVDGSVIPGLIGLEPVSPLLVMSMPGLKSCWPGR